MTDHELRALINKDLNAGAQALYQQYGRYVYAIIFRILRDCGTREDVEDCLSETFAEVVWHREQISGASIKAYIGQAARNRALNYARSLQKHSAVPLDSVAELQTGELHEEVETMERNRILKEKILALGEPDSVILIQRYYFRRSIAEIAGMVGLTPNNTKVRCSRALKRLRKELADWR